MAMARHVRGAMRCDDEDAQADAASLTLHARTRMQQRGIDAAALAHLLRYGRETHDHRGAVLLYFDKAARRRLEREAGEDARRMLPQLSRIYAVVSTTGAVMTVGHRMRRIGRNLRS